MLGEELVGLDADQDSDERDLLQVWAKGEITGSVQITDENVEALDVCVVLENASKLFQEGILAIVSEKAGGHGVISFWECYLRLMRVRSEPYSLDAMICWRAVGARGNGQGPGVLFVSAGLYALEQSEPGIRRLDEWSRVVEFLRRAVGEDPLGAWKGACRLPTLGGG